jgi:uncharacterized protein YmfQ (DUF2313 family)
MRVYVYAVKMGYQVQVYATKKEAFESVPHLHPFLPNNEWHWLMVNADGMTKAHIERIGVTVNE